MIRYVKAGGVTLVNDRDATFVDMPVFHNVALRTFADSNDMIGFADGLTELPGIDFRVNPMIELWVAQEDQVVDGDNAPSSGA